MRDIPDKTFYLALRTKTYEYLSTSLPTDYHKRILGRGLFLGVEQFLIFAPALKNNLYQTQRIDRQSRNQIATLITTLQRDFDGAYSPIRDKMTAHRQSMDLLAELGTWNDIDLSAISILSDQVVEIAKRLLGPLDEDAKILQIENVNTTYSGLSGALTVRFPLNSSAATISTDSLAMTRPNTVTLIPVHPNQEKLSRIMSCVDIFSFECACSHISQPFCEPHKSVLALLINDGFNILDNIFVDRPDDPSLLTSWRDGSYSGTSLLENFQRNRQMEDSLRAVRNHFCAHLDAQMELREIDNEFLNAAIVPFGNHINSLISTLYKGCHADSRTKMFLMRNSVVDALEVQTSGQVKPFS